MGKLLKVALHLVKQIQLKQLQKILIKDLIS